MQLRLAAALIAIFGGNAWAQDVQLSGTITVPLKTINNTSQQEIKLLKVKLSEKAKKAILKKIKAGIVEKPVANPIYPKTIQLGMNQVPVLQQGPYGSCVTFAVTAAIDAIIGRGDYMSQVCMLQLGNYLEQNSYSYSGWMGSYGRTVLAQAETTGIISKTKEAEFGCGGIKEYPYDGVIPESYMSLSDYKKLSEPLKKHSIAWSTILDINEDLDAIDFNTVLNKVKSSLYQGNRVNFAVLLPNYDLGFMGALATKNKDNDTWVLTPKNTTIDSHPEGGHEMIITGYDDNAVAIDENGKRHRGLLTLRNSWGENAGDNGDFYMSYAFFKALTYEAQRIFVCKAGECLD
jgi:C1A family cysteine protease